MPEPAGVRAARGRGTGRGGVVGVRAIVQSSGSRLPCWLVATTGGAVAPALLHRRCYSGAPEAGSPVAGGRASFDRQAVLWWDHVGKAGADARYAREMEVYLGMCRRWREIPKPSIAMVHGACIAGGLMLAWVCDLIVAAEDAFFADPVVRMGIPGVEYFAHPWVLGPRLAKEVLFTGGRFSAERAYQAGMVNRVVPRASLEALTFELAGQICGLPAFPW